MHAEGQGDWLEKKMFPERGQFLVVEVVRIEAIVQVDDDGVRQLRSDVPGGVASGLVTVHQDDDPRQIAKELALYWREMAAEQSDGGDAQLRQAQNAPWTLDQYDAALT